jgi:hypothetical protein
MWVCEKMGKTSNILWTWSVLTWFDHEIWWYSWFSDRASMIWSRLTFRECRTMSFNEFPMLVNSIANQLPTVGVCMCVPSSACRIKTWSRVAFCGCCYQEAIPCWWLSVQCIFLRDICDSPAEVFLPMKAGQRYGMCFSSQNSDWLAVPCQKSGTCDGQVRLLVKSAGNPTLNTGHWPYKFHRINHITTYIWGHYQDHQHVSQGAMYMGISSCSKTLIIISINSWLMWLLHIIP